MRQFLMPSLGADMDAGTLVEWLKQPGDRLERGDIIAVVETQKGAIEIEVFDNGILDATFVEPGAKVPVGQVLATIRSAGEPPGETLRPSRSERAVAAQLAQPPRAAPVPPSRPAFPERRADRARVTPLARRLAHERNIDISRLAPGADGVIGRREIERAPPSPRLRSAGIDGAEMRKAIASAMSRANREIPHYYVSTAIDVSPLVSWLGERNRTRPIEERLLYVSPLIKAVALALKRFEALNGHFQDGAFSPAMEVNIGVAIAMRGGGLIAPAIIGADRLDLSALMARLNDLVSRVRGGGLRSSELSMGTVALTNLGERTADSILPIIYPPQVAIIGCGQIRERPSVIDGRVLPRPILEVTVAGDHRVSDGRTGAQFLRRLEELLRKPEDL